MFWNKKRKLPITEEDRIWINEDLLWLRTEFGEKHFLEIKTITPTKNYYNRDFDGTEKDAEFVLEQTMNLMEINNSDVELEFFSDSPVKMEDGTNLSTPADINGSWSSAAGTYNEDNKEFRISIETEQLYNPVSLIATISHELAHLILLGENRIDENDEFLTDLTSIAYGFGIFIGNSRHQFYSNLSGWNTSTQGYLPEQVIAYAMAKLSHERNENIEYGKYLNSQVKKYFDQCVEWLNQN